MSGRQISWLPDGRRLHMNHGPIDLIVEAYGDEAEVQSAYRQAARRFQTVLDELVAELPELRQPATPRPRSFAGSIAQRMEAAVVPFAPAFITPMAAVAGAVADDVLAAMMLGRQLERAYVNDGGDIAIHLAPAARIKAAIGGTGHALSDHITLGGQQPVRGIATSGWRGRSFSLGIADAVTILARCAAQADAAATIVANAVDLPGHPAVSREVATSLTPDSDLGGRLVTTAVGRLHRGDVDAALDAGLAVADMLRRRGLIEGAALFLAGETRMCGVDHRHDTGVLPPPLPRPRRMERAAELRNPCQ